MGGGDLNLKKSWHPTTLRNMERVWKAEQKHEAEQKKIEELQKELANEKAREEIRQFAEDQGVLQKKASRLDWMYEGAGSLINREEYLLGKAVDKQIEQQNEFGISKSELDTIPESICRTSTGNVTVDLANKIREDPLLTIKKQEDDSRRKLLNNPIRMKQIQEILKKSSRPHKAKKSKKKSKRHSSDDDESSSPTPVRHRHGEVTRREGRYSTKTNSRYNSSERSRHSSFRRSRSPRKTRNDDEKRKREYSPPRRSPSRSQKSSKSMDDAERDRKLREMMENAKWRDDQRSQRIRRHIEELKKEVEQQKNNSDADFITPMLNKVATTESVSGRIKRNIYNIQRTKADLEKSFVKR